MVRPRAVREPHAATSAVDSIGAVTPGAPVVARWTKAGIINARFDRLIPGGRILGARRSRRVTPDDALPHG
ncbi:MAG: hypothetical protein R3E12_15550 [Candidatus Eisenbacteria bacterium]